MFLLPARWLLTRVSPELLPITFQALLILPLISSLALLMSSPIFLHTHLHVPLIEQQQQTQQFDDSAAGTTSTNEESGGDYDSPPPTAAPVDYWSHLVFCIEDWNYGGELGKEGVAIAIQMSAELPCLIKNLNQTLTMLLTPN